jgi:aquaporin Z
MDTKKYAAEFVGTFALVSSVCGAALFSAPAYGIITVALAIGAIVLAMAYAVGHISGGHFNPAVTCGLIAAGRFETSQAIPYIIAQVLGGFAAAVVFYIILSGAPPLTPPAKWKILSPSPTSTPGEGIRPPAVALIEIVLTAIFLIVIVGHVEEAAAGFSDRHRAHTRVLPTSPRSRFRTRRSTARSTRDCNFRRLGRARSGCSGWRRSSAV